MRLIFTALFFFLLASTALAGGQVKGQVLGGTRFALNPSDQRVETTSVSAIDLQLHYPIPETDFDFALLAFHSPDLADNKIGVGVRFTYRAFEVSLGSMPNLWRQSMMAIQTFPIGSALLPMMGTETTPQLGFGVSLRELRVKIALTQPYLERDRTLVDTDNDGQVDPGRPDRQWSEFDLAVQIPITQSILASYYYSSGYIVDHLDTSRQGHGYSVFIDMGSLEFAINGVVFERPSISANSNYDNDSHLTLGLSWGISDFYFAAKTGVLFGGQTETKAGQTNRDAYDSYYAALSIGYAVAPAWVVGVNSDYHTKTLSTDQPNQPDGSQFSFEIFLRMAL